MEVKINKNYSVALYIRLSKEDEKFSESESVSNQKKLLLKYVKDNDYNLVDIYIDDGFTGTNFNRPEFIRMIEDIKSNKINMVITKDLSRLGRDYIETGEYIEKWFPKHNIRYISILDGIDTLLDNSNNDIAPFKAIINDMYSKDNSKKIRSALRVMQEEGKWVGGCPPFGYMSDPSDKNHLIINKEEAIIVANIYKYALEGLSICNISKRLYDENIPTPTIMRKTNRNSKYSKMGYWNTTTIKKILTNYLYTGDMIQNRGSRISYKVRNIIKNCKDKWIIVENTHNAIISKKDFYRVSEILKVNNCLRQNKNKERILSGLLYCYECGKKLSLQKSRNNYYTICNTYRKYSKLKLCKSHSYNIDKLENIIIDKLKNIIVRNIYKDKTINNLHSNISNIVNSSLDLDNLKREITLKENNLDKMYLDKINNKITDEMYERISNNIKSEINILNKKIVKCLDIKKYNNDLDVCKKLVNNLFNMENISRKIVIKLIKKIELHDDKTIDIYFNFDVYH